MLYLRYVGDPAHAPWIPDLVEDDAALVRADQDCVLPISQDNTPHPQLARLAQCLGQERVGSGCHRAIRSDEVGGIVECGGGVIGIHKPFDVDYFCALELDVLEVTRLDDDIPAWLVLVAFADILIPNSFPARRASLVIANTSVVGFVELGEADALCGVDGVVYADGYRDQAEAQITFPDGSHTYLGMCVWAPSTRT